MNALALPDIVVSAVIGGPPAELTIDYPPLMDSPIVVFGNGNADDSYPQLGPVRSLKPTKIQTIGRDVIGLTIIAFSTVMAISLEEALPILQAQASLEIIIYKI